MNSVNIIFPNQLFKKSELINNHKTTYLVEEYLFFKQYSFHKQKILFHRDSMKNYYNYLIKQDLKVIYIDSFDNKWLLNQGVLVSATQKQTLKPLVEKLESMVSI